MYLSLTYNNFSLVVGLTKVIQSRLLKNDFNYCLILFFELLLSDYSLINV
jgi:hypothetical protein